MERSRGWCLTINNYKPGDCEWDIDDMPIDYLILGKEVGAKGTPHLQGFCYSKNKISFRRVKKLFPCAHIEKMKGTLSEAICYCMKDGDYLEFGDRPRQGRRTDLDIIKHDIKKNVPMDTIADKYFSQWCQYRRAFSEYADLKKSRRTIVIVLKYNIQKCWKKASEYFRGHYVVLDDSTLDKLYPFYYGKKYDYIITPSSAYTDEWDKDDIKNIIYV